MFLEEIEHDNTVNALVNDLAVTLSKLPKKTAQTMANAAYAVLVKHCRLYDQDPAWEVAIKKPGQPRHIPDDKCWVVVWESGPHDWAIPASMAIVHATGKLCEPYYSFDLCFYPSED
jgi:hypothetical protein